MNLKDYFPEVREGAFPLTDPEWISIEDGGRYWHFPKADLSEKEALLLTLGRSALSDVSRSVSPWERYLIRRQGNQPEVLERYQFLYLNHQQPLSDDLVAFLTSLFPEVSAVLPLSQTRTAFLLGQADAVELLTLLRPILPTIESDFGLALTVFVGNTWSQLVGAALRDIFEAENQLFSAYLTQKSSGRLLTFSEVMLWSLVVGEETPVLSQTIGQFMQSNAEMASLVRTLWQEQGNLVQTAQRLYIHRNSLQYKIEKFAHQTGLHVKTLDHLAVAYLVMLKGS
ncbi:helix-turn-helix domain-containing protein [Streptococcus phocae subsp. salmonis]|uniref:helix-turn-helix domain-containing protein n=1 Tax=Streptococcus phocae TaxID=119224 RepID=UPI0005320B1F|nr:helix-turn-helix domain-containing protein [Streptococcus phocae]KGR72449.1 PucR family transcriptional regulator [Streptococcus phocae subsp. salmonis]